MVRQKFSSPNEFGSGIYSRRHDDLLKMMQAAMQEQSLRQQGADYTSRPSASPGDNSETPPGGLLGRWFALQAAQQQPGPLREDRGPMPSTPADPNFRRLVRVFPAAQPQGGIGVSSGPSYSALGGGIPSDVQSTSDHGPGESVMDSERPAPVIAGFPRIGRAIPWPAMGPGTVPPIPMPQIPEWWQKAQELLKLYARMRSGKVGGRGRKDDDEYCYTREGSERGRCYSREEEYPHWDFRTACFDRATERRDMCVRNGGRPDPSEPPEWGPYDEEVFLNHGR